MFGRITLSLALIAALFIASERALAVTCVLPGTSTHKACPFACCAKKACCETLPKRAADPVQPLSTTNVLQKNFVALTAIIPTGKVEQPRAAKISGFSLAEHSRHYPETLALLCVRLI